VVSYRSWFDNTWDTYDVKKIDDVGSTISLTPAGGGAPLAQSLGDVGLIDTVCYVYSISGLPRNQYNAVQ